MRRYSDDANFETVTGRDGRPVRVLKDKGRIRVSMQMRDASMSRNSGLLESLERMTGQGERGQRGQVEGDLCTINGSEGRLRNVNGELRCVPLRSNDAKPQFTDGRTTDPFALQRPGFRIPVVNDRRAVHDAYTADDAYLRNRYKCGDGEQLCEDCDGEGYDADGNQCETCNSSGTVSARERSSGKRFGSTNEAGFDSRSVNQHDHRTTDQAYRDYDKSISEQWKTQ
jgi:hypothetical protein